MFNRKSKLQSSSEVVLRNVVVVGLIANYAIFLLYPVVMALLGSFAEWNPLVNVFRMIGFENYRRLLSDKLFWSSMLNTFVFSITVLVFRVGIGLMIAVAIYSNLIKSKSFYRTLFYMPVVTPLVAIAFVWRWIYNPQIGLANQLLGTYINWLRNPSYAMGSVIFMTIWKDFGFAVVIFLAGLYSLPKDCYEAAYIDGGSGRQVFWHITLPLLKPITFFIVITSMISYLQTYVPIWVMTEGGPGTKTYLVSYLIFHEAFRNYNFGYASSLSFILFVFISALTLLSFKITRDIGGEA
jgi:multiple sugar transport system permease protein